MFNASHWALDPHNSPRENEDSHGCPVAHLLFVVELKSHRGGNPLYLPEKFNNPLWLGLGATVLFSVFVLLLMGIGELLYLLFQVL